MEMTKKKKKTKTIEDKAKENEIKFEKYYK